MRNYSYDRRVATQSDLHPQDLKKGLNIVQIAHPEYGVWSVVEETPKGTWTVAKSRRPSDRIAVAEDELMRFWRKAKPSDKQATAVDFPVDTAFLVEVARIFGRKYAKAQFIMGTPEVKSSDSHGIIYLNARLHPFNDSHVDALYIWIGKDGDSRMTVSGSTPGEDHETQGFTHAHAEHKFKYTKQTEEQLAKMAFDLSKQMK